MINIITIQNGFTLRGEQRLFTNSELSDIYQILSDTQIWVEADEQIILLDVNECLINGNKLSTPLDLVAELKIINNA